MGFSTRTQSVEMLRPGIKDFFDKLSTDEEYAKKVSSEIRKKRKRKEKIEKAIERVRKEEGNNYEKGYQHYKDIINKAFCLLNKGFRDNPEGYFTEETLMRWNHLEDNGPDPIVTYGNREIFLDKHHFRLYYLIAIVKCYIGVEEKE